MKQSKLIISMPLQKKTVWGNDLERPGRWTYRHLVDLYSLDPSLTLFRSLFIFLEKIYRRASLSLALTMRLRTRFCSSFYGTVCAPISRRLDSFSREAWRIHDNHEPGRLAGNFKSTAQNINSTWQNPSLYGKSVKYVLVQLRLRAVAYALFWGIWSAVAERPFLNLIHISLIFLLRRLWVSRGRMRVRMDHFQTDWWCHKVLFFPIC